MVALGLALGTAWGLAGVEALGFAPLAEQARFPVLGAWVGLWTLWGLVSGAVGAGAAVLWSRLSARRAGPHVSAPLVWGALLPLGGLVLHRVGLVLSDRSSETLLLGVVLTALLLAPLLGALGRWAGQALVQRDAAPPTPRARAVQVSLMILAWAGLLGSLAYSHRDYLAELFTHDTSWGALALGLPPLSGWLGATLMGPRAPGWVSSKLGWVSSHASPVVRRRLWAGLLLLALTGLGVGVLAARAARTAEVRVLRDHAGPSAPLVWAAFRVGVPVPTLGPAQGLRGCAPGQGLGAEGSVGSVGAGAPDILLITVDGLRFDHTSLASGSAHPNTPRLLARAEQAAVFTRAYTPAPSTRAAFRAIFTGLLPGQVDAPPDARFPWALTLTPAQPTLAAYLRDAGYETVAFVSKPKAFPVATHALRGFAEVDDTATPYHLRHQHSAQLIVSRIIGRLAEPPAQAAAPRFVWTHLIEPHYPYTHGPSDAVGTEEAPARDHEARHDLAVRFIDEQLERLLAFALAPERRDRTVVVITADHGEAFGEHRNSRHGATVFEEELHVPLLVFGPGVRPGTRATPVSLVELLPTLLRLAGLEPPLGVCGEGWADALERGGEPSSAPLYAAALPDPTARYHQLAFIDGNEKLIVDGETGAARRYDLRTDPRERSPDQGSPAAAALRARLENFLRARGLSVPPAP